MKFAPILLTSLCLSMGVAAPVNASEPEDERMSLPVLISQSVEPSYASSEGQFTIQFPGEPETRTRTLPIAGQAYDWTILRLQTEGGFYGVAYTDLTSETIELGANAVIDSIKNTLADELDWSALTDRGQPTTINGYPAREIIGAQDNQLSVLHLVLADQRLYVVMSTSTDLTEIAQFLDSFTVEPWQPYVSEDGGFSVNLPLEPSDETKLITLGETEFEWTIIEGRNFTAPDDSYSVGYTDVPSQDLEAGTDALLNRVGSYVIERWQAQNVVENGRQLSLDGNPGRSFIGTTPEGQIVAVRFYLVGQRLYGVGALSDNVGNLSQFLDSFEVQ